MSISKRFYSLVLAILAVFALVGCTLPTAFSRTVSEAEADLAYVADSIFFTEADLQVVSDLEFTTTTGWAEKITFEWSTSNEAVISKEGKVTRPEYGLGNAEVVVKVVITAEYTKLDDGTFKLGTVSTEKEWTFTVLEAGKVYTIADIKNDLTFVADETEVSFKGVVVAFSNYKGGHYPFVYDGTDGMYVYIDSPEVKVGDYVQVNAKYDVYYNLVQVSDGGVTVLESDAELPAVEKGQISEVVAANGYMISETVGVAAGKVHNVDAKVVVETSGGYENAYLQDPFTGERFIVHYETGFDYVPGNTAETYLDLLKSYDGKYVNITVTNYDRKDGEERICLSAYPIVEIEEPKLSDEQKATISLNSLAVAEAAIEDFTLPAEVEHGTVAWEVVSGTGIEIVDGVAKVTRTTVAQEAVLKATVTVGEAVLTKEFTVAIAGLVFEPISYEEATTLAGTDGSYTSDKYYLEGVITEVYNTQYGNMYITDGVNTFTIYGTYSADGSLRYDVMENAPKAGDRVIVYGILGSYKGAAQMKNGWIVAQEPATEFETVSNTKAIELSGTTKNEYTTEKYNIKGIVTEVANTTYGNMYVQDIYGVSFYVYGVYSHDGSTRYDAMEKAPQVGDFVVLSGILGYYSDAQMKNGWLVQLNNEVYGATEPEHTHNLCPECGKCLDEKCPDGDVCQGHEVASNVITIAEAIEIASKQAHDTYTTEKYIVTGTVDDLYNTTYGNMHLLDGKGGDLTIYGLYFGGVKYGDFTGTKPVVGDVITVEGRLGTYNGTPQMKSADFVEFAGQTPEPPVHEHNACPECGKCLDKECPDGDVCQGHEVVADYITIAEAKKSELNASITVKGVVSTKTSSHILIQDGKDGIQLYYASNAAEFASIKVGDEILATGTYTVYNGLHEIKSIKKLEVLSSGHEVKPIVITSVAKADIEQYQNMLVTVELTYVSGSIANKANSTFEDANGVTVTVRPDSTWGTIPTLTLTAGDKVVVTGYVNWYNNPQISNVPDYDFIVVSGGELPHEHVFVNGKCECGEEDPNYVAPHEHELCPECNKCLDKECPDGDVCQGHEEVVVDGRADFETIVTSNANGDSSYTKTFTTTAGWVVKNSAIQCGGSKDMNPQFTVIGPDNTYKAVCMNGKVGAAGSITSPTLTGGISVLNIAYTKMFTDTALKATVTVTEVATGNVQTHVIDVTLPKDEKYVVYPVEWVLETPITGDFTIEIVNNCPSANSSSNKDRLTVLSIEWVAPKQTPAEPVFADLESFTKGDGKDTSYVERTNAAGWVATNARCDEQTAFGDAQQLTLNGKNSAVGTLTSTVISGGVSKVSFNYGYAFSESGKVKLIINIKDTEGKVVATTTLEASGIVQEATNEFVWELETPVEGDFVLELVNGCPSNSSKNKDRLTIWNLAWLA